MKVNQCNICQKLLKLVFWLAFYSSLGFANQGLADDVVVSAGQTLDNWERASDSELDQLRGGFMLPNGVIVDFSLARTTTINNVEVSASYYQLPGNVLIVQNGVAQNQPGSYALSPLGTVIQNRLDNVTISNVAQMNLAISNLKSLASNNNGMFFNNYIAPNTR